MRNARSVYINIRSFNQPLSGVGRYAREIANRLPLEYGRISPGESRSGGVPGHLWEQAAVPVLVRRGVLWSPANTGPLAVRRQVLTIHDLGPLEHPEWYAPMFARWYRWLWPRLAPNVHHVLTDSQFSRGRIIQWLGISEDRVTCVPVGVDPAVFSPVDQDERTRVRARFGIQGPFLLFAGTHQPRKNLGRLLEAWDVVRGRFTDWQLVIAGGEGAQFARTRPIQGAGVRLLGSVEDADLPALYSAASVFIQPSLYEGAGLTVLEAMACGCACAAAGGSALPEYGGDAAIYFDPFRPEEIAAALDRLLSDAAERERLAAVGIGRARMFTWEKPAEKVRQILEALRRLPASLR